MTCTSVPGVRGVDEAAAADVHADVADAVEEDEVAGAERAARDAAAEVEVGVGAVREARSRSGRRRSARSRSSRSRRCGESPPQRYGTPSSRRAKRTARTPTGLRAASRGACGRCRREPVRLQPRQPWSALGSPSACPGRRAAQYAERERRAGVDGAVQSWGESRRRRPAAQRVPGIVWADSLNQTRRARRMPRSGDRIPEGSVEAALGRLEALGVERLDRVGGPRDEPIGVLVRLEVGEHVVGERATVAAARAGRRRRAAAGSPACRGAAPPTGGRCARRARRRAAPGAGPARGRSRRGRRGSRRARA